MPTLTQDQIVQVARAGGLPGDPEVWAAIAMAESSGRTDIVNSIGCVGLWQINQPAHVGSHPTWTVSWLSNPLNNAKAAAVVYRAQGFGAWEAYTGPDGKGSDGPWRNYYRGSKAGSATQVFDWGDIFGPPSWKDVQRGEGWADGMTKDVPGPSLTDVGDVAKGVGAIAEAVQKTAVWLGNAKNWERIGYVAGGALLVVLGLTIVARPVINGAMNATPAGRAVKVAATAVKAKASSSKTKTKGGGGGGE